MSDTQEFVGWSAHLAGGAKAEIRRRPDGSWAGRLGNDHQYHSTYSAAIVVRHATYAAALEWLVGCTQTGVVAAAAVTLTAILVPFVNEDETGATLA